MGHHIKLIIIKHPIENHCKNRYGWLVGYPSGGRLERWRLQRQAIENRQNCISEIPSTLREVAQRHARYLCRKLCLGYVCATLLEFVLLELSEKA